MRNKLLSSICAALVIYFSEGLYVLADNACLEQCNLDQEACKDEGILLPKTCAKIFLSCVELCQPDTELPERQAELSVRKVLVPETDPGRFNLLIDGIVEGNNLGHLESTDPVALPAGNHTVSETVTGTTSLENYISSICGSCSRNGGINLRGGDEATCVITNLRPTYSIPACRNFCGDRHKECLNDPDTANKLCVKLLRACEKSCVTAPIYRVGVSHHVNVALTEEYADEVLSGASSALRISRDSDDFACNVALCRDGPINAFNVGDGLVDSGFELLEIIALPGEVKLVTAIDICFNRLDPSIEGCAELPGDSFVAELTGIDFIDRIIWAHEFGHNKGLEHRCPTGSELMCETLAVGSQTEINRSECELFDGTRVITQSSSRLGPKIANYNIGIKEFVRKLYFDGIATELAKSNYGEKDVPILLGMLKDPDEKLYWVNVVVALGLLGPESTVGYLINFIEKGSKNSISIQEFKAKTAAIISLGYLVNRTGSKKALKYLQEGTTLDSWDKRNIKWRSVQGFNLKINQSLSRYSILGLGLSGNDLALNTLRTLTETTKRHPDQLFRINAQDVVISAIETNRKISDIGILKYYREKN